MNSLYMSILLFISFVSNILPVSLLYGHAPCYARIAMYSQYFYSILAISRHPLCKASEIFPRKEEQQTQIRTGISLFLSKSHRQHKDRSFTRLEGRNREVCSGNCHGGRAAPTAALAQLGGGRSGGIVSSGDLRLLPERYEQEEDVGVPLRPRLRDPPLFHVELPQEHTLLVQASVGSFWVARSLRVGDAGSGVRDLVHGGGPRRGRSCNPGDVDHRRGASGILREAPAGPGVGGQEDDEGDCRICLQDSAQGRQFCGGSLCYFRLLCSREEEQGS